MIDNYCERLGPEFWAEPVNALTNLSFLFAAWAGSRLARAEGVRAGDIYLLLLLTLSIGIGSFLFHTLANFWSRLADVIPILVFQLVFIWVYCRRIVGYERWRVSGLVLAFFVLALWSRQFSHLLNGSIMYLPAFLVLLWIGLDYSLRVQRERKLLLWASGLFLLSLTFRSIDMQVCNGFPLGTHFLWHLFNGLLLYLVCRGLILNWPKPSSR